MSRVLVMGPGRSGSNYLCDMLNELGFETIHEHTRKFRGEQKSFLEDCHWNDAAQWLTGDNRALCGFPYGFMVYYLRHRVQELRVICVHREKDNWLKSVGKSEVGNATSWPRGLKSIEEYWEIYEHLMLSVTSPVLRLTMKDLDGCKPTVKQFVE